MKLNKENGRSENLRSRIQTAERVYLLKGFDFDDGLGVQSDEAVPDGLGHVLRGFGPRRLEERERHRRKAFRRRSARRPAFDQAFASRSFFFSFFFFFYSPSLSLRVVPWLSSFSLFYFHHFTFLLFNLKLEFVSFYFSTHTPPHHTQMQCSIKRHVVAFYKTNAKPNYMSY